ncbi:MAG: MraY family glycosyltransferase [Betaproteobacteria bacterium]
MSAAWLSVLVLPFAIAWTVTRVLAKSGWARSVADVPNERSLHAVPTPRVGGVGILAGAIPLAAWHGGATLMPLLVCALCLAIVSLIDDVRSLPIQVRLPAHFVAALVAVFTLSQPFAGELAWIVAVGAMLAIVWVTNLFNFMDGSDGLAGGMATIGFACLAFAARGADAPLALSAAALASAAAGFLALNFPPARAFMGDAGSIPLGFLAATLGLEGIAENTWPAWFPVLVFSPFIVDASVTLARRALRREAFWRAHRSHYYQRLVLSGWSHRRLALAAYSVMIAAGASALAALRAGPAGRYAIIAAWVAMYAAVFFAIDRHAPPPGPR